jgi:predicted DNA-binding protein
MMMNFKVSATLDARSEAVLNRIMKRTGWTKSQVLREAIWAVAESQAPAKRPAMNGYAKGRTKS